MKQFYTFALLALSLVATAQDGAPASPYYDGFNFNQTGTSLKDDLATKIISTHTNLLTYTPGIWEALKVTDADPAATNYVMLLYGYSTDVCPASTGNDNVHRRRLKDSNGGGNSCEWNREHVFPQSLGNPELGQEGAGADAHHLRACDVDRNGERGNKLYTTGSGNSGNSGSGWYPGDEWKGDVARILMYLYLHYGSQCLPTVAVMGETVSTDSNMPLILLQWNAEDPVTDFEDQRNTYLGNAGNPYGQGNRNPFIDNPYLATLIWGGPVAEDRWDLTGFDNAFAAQLAVYPNPSVNHEINIYSEADLTEIQLVNLNGQLVQKIAMPNAVNHNYTLSNLPQGFYLLKVTAGENTATKKVVVN